MATATKREMQKARDRNKKLFKQLAEQKQARYLAQVYAIAARTGLIAIEALIDDNLEMHGSGLKVTTIQSQIEQIIKTGLRE